MSYDNRHKLILLINIVVCIDFF